MQIRSPGEPDEPDDDRPPLRPPSGRTEAERAAHEGVPGARYGPDGSVTFRIARGVVTAKFVLAGLLLLVALFVGGRTELVLGLIGAVGVALYGLRDVLRPDRLRADADGVRVVAGFAGHRTLAWSELERIRVDERTRLGVRNDLLELDVGEEIYLLSRYDLGADPRDALTVLTALEPVRRPGPDRGEGG